MDGSDELPPVGIIGAGAVGSTLARRLVERGYRVEAVLSRHTENARALAEEVDAPIAGTLTEGLPSPVRLLVVCVPDDAIKSVAQGMAALSHPWPETTVAHTSGVHTARILAPLAAQGAATLSFHPLQTFAPETPPEAFEDIVVGLEGEGQALMVGEALAQALGARPVRLASEDKVRYHCAAALASNGLVALLSVVEEVFGSGGLAAVSSLDLVGPLVEQTWQNLQEGPPERELTGPVARGDLKTIQAHLDALTETTPHLVPLYVALSTQLLRLAVQGGHLDQQQAEAMIEALEAAHEASTDNTDSSHLLH